MKAILSFLGSITLHDVDPADNCADGDGAFTHYTTWVNNHLSVYGNHAV